MKKVLTMLAVCATVAGCVDMTTAPPTGAVKVAPNGARTFTFAIGENVLDHPHALSFWAAKEGNCPGGYKVLSTKKYEGAVIYEGTCRR